MNVPLWTFSISQELSRKIEKVQRVAAFIILGKFAHNDYRSNLAILNLEPLSERREKISKKFAFKTLKHPVHQNIFTHVTRQNGRSGRKVIVPTSKTKRYERSSIPALSRIINQNSN